MSFLLGLAAVALFLLLLFLTVVKHRADTALYQKLHPPKKQQEEFLKACALYLEYRNAPEAHPSPVRDAKRDAALAIQEEGFLPAALEHLAFPKKEEKRMALLCADGEPQPFTYQALQTASEEAFRVCQQQDQGLTGYSQDPRFWNGETFDTQAWEVYCGEMDRAFRELADRFSRENGNET